jgi:inosine-uridine nucleoside N-ribohydrolase
VRLWIDTDVGGDPDDAVALLCAVGHPDVDVVGVSTADDESAWRARVAATLVDAPVVPGPSVSTHEVAESEPDALLAIGPLENVARLLAAGVLPPRVGVMGGVLQPVRHRGELWEVEYNFGREPAATHAVVGHAGGTLLCPLDVTVRMRASDAHLRALVDGAPVLGPMFDQWLGQQRAADIPDAESGVRLHDPLALLALLGEPVVAIEPRALTADSNGRVSEDGGGEHVVDVVTDVDVVRAMERIVELVARSGQAAQ